MNRFIETMVDFVGLFDSAIAINKCTSKEALKGLKKIIEDRLKKLDGNEQSTDFTEQTVVKTEQIKEKPEQIKEKTEQKSIKQYDQALYPRDKIAKIYGTTTIYTPIIEIILKETKDEFRRTNVSNILYDHYLHTLKRKITQGSAEAYASTYVRHMLSIGLIEKIGKEKYKPLFKKCTAVQKKDPDIIEDFEENKQKAVTEKLAFEREVCE